MIARGQNSSASHARSFQAGQTTTIAQHRPKAHQQYLEWTPSRLLSWAEAAGPNTAELSRQILASKPHPEMCYRFCLGLVRLGGKYTTVRLEAAAARALHFGAYTLPWLMSSAARFRSEVIEITIPRLSKSPFRARAIL